MAMAALHEMAADARMDPGELSTLLGATLVPIITNAITTSNENARCITVDQTDDTTGVQIMEQLQAMRNDMQAFKEAIKSVAQKVGNS